MGEITTPFNSLYSASKAAVTRFTDALRMELAPFNIHTVTIKPGGVRSNIANNAKEKVEKYVHSFSFLLSFPFLPPFGLFTLYLTIGRLIQGPSTYKLITDFIKLRSQVSQQNPMDTKVFAEKVVFQILKSNPPACMYLGTKSTLLYLCMFLFQNVILFVLTIIVSKFLPFWLYDWMYSRLFGLSLLRSLLNADQTSSSHSKKLK